MLYRPNVAAILERKGGKILIGERIDRPGTWQFPQGGVDEGEDLLAALWREVEEEIGVAPSLYKVVEQRGGYRYKFPNGHVKWKVFRGQEQTYFRCRFKGDDSDIDLDTKSPEFASYRWIAPKKFDLDWLPKFKRAVYRQVLADFFDV